MTCPMITFRVYGVPQTKGSTKAFMPKGAKFPIVTNDNPKNKGWAALISSVAQDHAPPTLWEGPLGVQYVFHLYPPKTLLKRDKYKVTTVTKKPDLDKMVRSVNDALAGIIFLDDKQIVRSAESKVYSESPGVEIMLINLAEGAL